MKKIYNAKDTIEAQYLCDLLEEAGIGAYMQESGAGEYLKVSSGLNVFGTDIFVNEEDEKAGKEILHSHFAEEKKRAEEPEHRIPWYRNRVFLARMVAVYFLLINFILLLVSYLTH